MAHDARSLIQALEAELEFLESGRYSRESEGSWKAPRLFLDSPSCLNFRLPHRPHPCTECFLIEFVPSPFLEENVPCHFIPLNQQRETIDSLERQAHQTEMEGAVKDWLRATIALLRATSSNSLSTEEPEAGPAPS